MSQEDKTFTQEDVDRIVQERVAREREKYGDYETLKDKASKLDEIEEANKSELEKMTEQNQALQSQLDQLTAQSELRKAQDKVATETGLPISVVKTLSGSSVEELTTSAQAILDFSKNSNGYPQLKNSSNSKPQPVSKEEKFATWLKANLD